MNQTVFNIVDFHPNHINPSQLIEAKEFNVKKLYQSSLNNVDNLDFFVITKRPKKFIKKLKAKFCYIKAAGGLVTNPNREYLFIYRLGKWDLPKGKMEKKENWKKTAIREVEEECGIKVDPNIEKFVKTYHLYPYKGDFALKKTTWYKMKISRNQNLTVQTEEGITDAKWVTVNQIPKLMENSYRMVSDMVKNLIPA